MKIYEVEGPKTPEQMRLAQLTATSQRASAAVKQERVRQKTHKAQQTLQKLRAPIKPIQTVKPIKTV
jgi:hypothetical protein